MKKKWTKMNFGCVTKLINKEVIKRQEEKKMKHKDTASSEIHVSMLFRLLP